MAPRDPLPGPRDVSPRTLSRSTTDKRITGVAGGLGQAFAIDPVIFRVAFAAATLISGLGLLAYVALSLILPRDDGRPAWLQGRSRLTTIVVAGIIAVISLRSLSGPGFLLGPGLFGVAALSVAGLALYRGFGPSVREDPAKAIARATLAVLAAAAMLGAATGIGLIAAIGGGTAIAVLAIVAGFGLVAAGLLGGPRWLIVPVVVLVAPLAVVSAADIDLTGGVGERAYRPATVAELRPEYRLGVGSLELDLRRLDLSAAATDVNVRLGIGEARLRVPRGTCVVTDAQIGVGAADLPEREGQGLDVSIAPVTPPAGRRVVRVRADIGVGHLLIDHPDPACA